MEIPKNIEAILQMFTSTTTYIYGKAIREMLLGRSPRTCRIITSAPPNILYRMFPRGSMLKGRFRVNADGCDLVIISSRSGPEDLCAAQDFTIDSAAYSDITGIIDNHGALDDIQNGVIRLLHNDESTIHTNPTVMLKAVRLCAELGFTLDGETASLITACAPRIRSAYTRQITYELELLLMSPRPDYFRELNKLNLLKHIIPQLDRCFGETQRNKYHIYDVGEHIMHAVKNTPKDYVLRWAALLHDVGKPCCSSTDSNGIIHFYGHHHESRIIADDILHRYGIDRDAAKDILTLIENHDVRVEPSPIPVKKMMCRTGGELFEKLMLLQTADNMAKNPKYFTEKYSRINEALQISKHVLAEGEPYQYSQLKVNSRDLQKRGIRPGRETNDIMRMLMEDVIANPAHNMRDYLLNRAKDLQRQ